MPSDTLFLIYHVVPVELGNTLYMVSVATVMALLVGGPLGLLLALTRGGGRQAFCHHFFATAVNIGRSIPFAILMVALIPLTRLLVGTSLGTTGAIVPLTIAVLCPFSRMVESAFSEVDKGLISVAKAMGAHTWQVVIKVLLPESLPTLIQAVTQMIIQLISFSAMAGLVGGGGLGKVAIQYGYQRFEPWVIVATVALMVLLVQGVQWSGSFLAKRIQIRRGI